MVSQKVTIKNKSGIHARPAGELTKIAKNCKSDILLLLENKAVNPKGVLNLMAAAIKQGTEVTVQCDGESEADDLKLIVDAINSGLGE